MSGVITKRHIILFILFTFNVNIIVLLIKSLLELSNRFSYDLDI